MILAHFGGLPLEESLIYLVPPLGVVLWIWVLGRRGRDDPPEPDPLEDLAEDHAAGAPAGSRREDRPG